MTLSTYPSDIAKALRSRWIEGGHSEHLLPDDSSLTMILDTMYQASLLREEGESVRCRIIVGAPSSFSAISNLDPEDVHLLQFEKLSEFSPDDIRKLAAAAGFYRAMLAIQVHPKTSATIWGMVVTGTAWVNQVESGKFTGRPLPENLIVQILGPGHLVASSGYTRVLECSGGKLLTDGFDPFRSKWLPSQFAAIRLSLLAELESEAIESPSVRLCDAFVKDIAQSVVRRVLSLVRTRAHGGMLVYLPDDIACNTENWIRFRVRFQPDESSKRFRLLMLKVMQRALEIGVLQGLSIITWEDFQKMQDNVLSHLKASLIEFAHFLADLMSVDGSLVLNRSFGLIGFGGEIMGDSHVTSIDRALDLEAEQSVPESAESGGTRHRSAYRLVSGIPDAIAVVVSQDGGVRFVANRNGKLTYWPYLP